TPFTKCDVYTQHSTATGCASGTQPRLSTCSKNEFHVLGGAITRLAWTSDNQRLIIVGEGREKFGVAILADSGASVGEIIGHSKAINSVDFKPQRPFRAVTASEDFVVCFYEGPPFKFKKQNDDEHTNFVNVVRYAPSGELFASAGSTGRILLHEGKTSEYGRDWRPGARAQFIRWPSARPNSDRLLSVSGDKTARLWNVQDKRMVVRQHNKRHASQLPVVQRLRHHRIAGRQFEFSRPGQSRKPTEVIGGHSKPITALDRTRADGRTLVTGSTDASLALAVDASGTVYSVAMDDTL
uniref:WD_REPEATS_REGION domain-containing protein n=1 Tax=Macrostomum lignano TaxID=282301 RepID=A0A1I8FMT7_9PLAT